ncbi:MAG: relaxase/mobilization nuclease domain-containing protein [Rikenellaceae bacterium]
MIAKNIKSRSFAASIRYVMKADAEVLKAEGVMAMDTQSIINSFEFQRAPRSEIKAPAGHIPVSFAPEDRELLTNEKMIFLAEEYMKAMGIVDTQYIIVRHNDTDNAHFHIVYNRIDNNSKLISDKNDYRRNVAVCKMLKDKYDLTYGRDKSRVKREKLRGSERIKYKIHDVIQRHLPNSRNIEELQKRIEKEGIYVEVHFRSGTSQPQGILFAKGGYRFKGSQVDRKFSWNGLSKTFAENVHRQQEPKKFYLLGKELTDEQVLQLVYGNKAFVEGMTAKSGKKYSRFVRLSEDRKRFEFSSKDIPRKIGNVQLTEQQMSEIDDGKTLYFNGTVGKDGVAHDIKVYWSDEKSQLMIDSLKTSAKQAQEQPIAPDNSASIGETLLVGALSIFGDPQGGTDPDENLEQDRFRQQPTKKPKRKVRW